MSLNQSFLRATVATDDLLFQPTLDPKQVHQGQEKFSLHTYSSLLFSGQGQMLDRRSRPISQPTSTTDDQQRRFKSLRSHILLDKERASRSQALNAIERHDYEAVRNKQYQKNRDSQVILYRRYRIGDYPDFHINSLAFLMPLQALAKCDNQLARQLMVTIFEAVTVAAGPEQRAFIVALNACIKSMFARARACDSMFFSTLIEMALTFPQHFDLQPDVVATIASENSTMAIGILFVESRLALDLLTGRSPNSSASIDNAELHWFKLAAMYYNLSEHDIVADILVDKFRSNQTLCLAIEKEAQGDFQTAAACYSEFINMPVMDAQGHLLRDFAFESCFSCYENMGQWEELAEMLEDQVTDVNYEELFANDWNEEHLLPHYVRSHTRITLDRAAAERSFIDNMTQWLRHSERSEYIQQNFAEELMMLHICDDKLLESRVHSEKHFTRFLAEWANLNVLSDKVRANKILNIRNVAEMHKYVDWLVVADQPENILDKFAERWNHTHIQSSDSMQMWNTLIAYRKYVHSKVHKILDLHHANVRLAESMDEHVFDMQIDLADVALRQQNLVLSDRLIQQTSTRLITDLNDRYSAQWNILQSKYLAQRGMLEENDHGRSMALLLESWVKVDDTIQGHDAVMTVHPELHAKALQQVAAVSEEVFNRIADGISDRSREIIMQYTKLSTSDAIDVRLFDHTVKTLAKVIDLVDDGETGAVRDSNFIGDTYQRIAMFSIQNLHRMPDIETEKNVVRSVLRGMRHNSKTAQLQFPQILTLSSISIPELTYLFDEEVIIPNEDYSNLDIKINHSN